MTRRKLVAAASALLLLGAAAGLFAYVLTREPSTPEEPPAAAPATTGTAPGEKDRFAELRLAMVERQIAERGVADPRVLEAMRAVPRHEFVPPELVDEAYEDHPLPIGFGQTISQPYIVALMTELLELRDGDRVLEIGTGSGFQAAVLAELTDEVYSVEIIPALALSATARLERLGYTSIRVLNADGYYGWREHAPFDAIIVTAAPDHVPPPLVRQLADGGRLVIPVGPPGSYQTLWRIRKQGGEVSSENITGVIFVPLVRETPAGP